MRNHGLSNTETYKTWESIRQRCVGNHPSKKNYKDKGITVDPRWNYYPNFLADMGERQPGMTIERIDGSKGYSKENCKWATRAEQNRNTSRNKIYSYEGELLCVAEIARRSGIKERTLHYRLDEGLPIEQAVSKEKFLSHGKGGKYIKKCKPLTDSDLRSGLFR